MPSLLLILFVLLALLLWRLIHVWRQLWRGIPRSNRDFSPFFLQD